MIPRGKGPFDLFAEWFDEAKRHPEISEPSAMTLATADPTGMPWSRIVLLKDFSPDGFTFYTNLGSPKARHLDANPKASLCFYWMPSNKQVRIQGRSIRVMDQEADAYFATRPRESQIGAWASKQSERLASRDELNARVAQYAREFEGRPVPRPPFWSGYRIIPERMEFWLRMPHRLHDRLVYEFNGHGGWTATALYP